MGTLRSYSVEDTIIPDVLATLDQNQSESAIIAAEANTLELRDVVTRNIAVSAAWLFANAPRQSIDGGWDLAGLTPAQGGDGVWFLDISGLRMLRFLFLQLSSWRHPAYQAIDESGPLYAQARSAFPGIAGNAERPVVADVFSVSGGVRVLELYPCSGDDTVTRGLYLREPAIEDGSLEMPGSLYDALVLHTAGAAAQDCGEAAVAQQMFARACSHAGIQLQQEQKGRAR